MIEILFSDSAAGSLKQAIKGLGGSHEDIFPLGLAWDMGDISEEGVGEKRLETLDMLYSIYDDDTRKGAKIQYEKAKTDLETVVNRAKNGENIRVWYSSNPGEYCGMLWFMAQLRNINDKIGKVFAVRLPAYVFSEDNKTAKSYRGTGEIAPEEWKDFAKFSTDITEKYWVYAEEWWRLQGENSALRALLNGKMRSVSEDIYDSYIFAALDEEEEDIFVQANVIGKVLSKYLPDVGDGYIALRMEGMISGGILEVVPKTSRGPAIYHRKLKKMY